MVASWRSLSLRAQLITIMSLLMVIVVGVTCALTISFLRGFLIQQLDENLSNNRQDVSNRLFGMTDSSSVPLTNYYGALFTPGGEQVISFESDDAPKLGHPTLAEVKALAGKPMTVPGTAEDSEGWRVRFYPLESGEGTVAVALPLEDTSELIGHATRRILTGGLLATILAAAVAYLAVTRAFKPLTRMEKTAASIAAGDLSQRVRVENPYTEVGHLSKSLNAMLAHIEGAFASRTASEKRMRQFVADASHELRTPLVTIRGFSELHRHGALQTEEDVSTAMGRIENEAKRMGRMVEDLLMLARIDEQRPLEMRPVDLLLLANDAATDAMAGSRDRQIRVISLDGGKPTSAPTAGDEPRLRQVVANLVTNALRYTPEGSPIEIAVGTQRVIDERKDSILQVRDHGPGISDEEAARVFERFYRADTSRTRETGGSGLGLAIVAAIVAQHDGTVRLDDSEGGGATMWIRLPYVEPPSDAGEAGDETDNSATVSTARESRSIDSGR